MSITIVDSKKIYSNDHASVIVDKLSVSNYEWEQVYIEKPYMDGVGVLPVDDKGIYLVSQYRHPIKKDLWQIIMGTLDAGESSNDAALRELREEGGITGANLSQVGTMYAEPGISSQKTTIFIAKNLFFGDSDFDKTEINLKIKHFTFEEVGSMLLRNEIVCGFTLSTFFLCRKMILF